MQKKTYRSNEFFPRREFDMHQHSFWPIRPRKQTSLLNELIHLTAATKLLSRFFDLSIFAKILMFSSLVFRRERRVKRVRYEG